MSSEQASEIQRKMYEFIEKYIEAEGMPPTNREIGRAMNIASTGHVDYHLTMLEKKGLISRQEKKSRGIRLIKPSRLQGVPIQGYIAAGEPLDIFPEPEDSIDIGRNLVDAENAYALVVKGRSMIEDHICDGDYVVIKPQKTAENGDIVVAVHRQDNGQATLKRFYQEKEQNRVRLQPANSTMNPIFIPKTEWDKEWEIQGKVVAIFRKCYAA